MHEHQRPGRQLANIPLRKRESPRDAQQVDRLPDSVARFPDQSPVQFKRHQANLAAYIDQLTGGMSFADHLSFQEDLVTRDKDERKQPTQKPKPQQKKADSPAEAREPEAESGYINGTSATTTKPTPTRSPTESCEANPLRRCSTRRRRASQMRQHNRHRYSS